MENENTTETKYIQIVDQDGDTINVEVDDDGLPACDLVEHDRDDDVWFITASTDYSNETILGVFIDGEESARYAIDAILAGETTVVGGDKVSARKYLIAIGESPSIAERGQSALDYVNSYAR